MSPASNVRHGFEPRRSLNFFLLLSSFLQLLKLRIFAYLDLRNCFVALHDNKWIINQFLKADISSLSY